MRIVLATPLYPPESGGPATYAKLLEEHLEHEVCVIKFSEVRSYPKLIRHLLYAIKVFRAARGADCVMALDPMSVGVPAYIAARLRRKKFVVKVVGDYAWEQGVQRYGLTETLDTFIYLRAVPFQVQMMRKLQSYIARSADGVLVPSEYLRGIVTSWGVPNKKITTIYNAVELELNGKVPQIVEEAARPRTVVVGRLVPWKNIDGVIDAVSSIDSPASLIVVGDGPERERLESKAQAHPRIYFTGALTHADALAVVDQADIFVLNSTYEGLSHVLIEALMLGKAVVATRAGGNAELIRDGENGVLVPVSDTAALAQALDHFLKNPDSARSLGEVARQAREEFSVDRMRIKTAEFLTTV